MALRKGHVLKLDGEVFEFSASEEDFRTVRDLKTLLAGLDSCSPPTAFVKLLQQVPPSSSSAGSSPAVASTDSIELADDTQVPFEALWERDAAVDVHHLPLQYLVCPDMKAVVLKLCPELELEKYDGFWLAVEQADYPLQTMFLSASRLLFSDTGCINRILINVDDNPVACDARQDFWSSLRYIIMGLPADVGSAVHKNGHTVLHDMIHCVKNLCCPRDADELEGIIVDFVQRIDLAIRGKDLSTAVDWQELGTVDPGLVRDLAFMAARAGDAALLTTLIQHGTNPDSIEEKEMWEEADPSDPTFNEDTLLTVGASRGHESIVSLLIEAGADPDKPNQVQSHRAGYRLTPLAHAAQQGFDAIVHRLLIARADIDANDGGAESLHVQPLTLMLALGKCKDTTVRMLVDAKPNLNATRSDSRAHGGWPITALHRAADEGLLEEVRILVNARADVCLPAQEGITAMTFAAKSCVNAVKEGWNADKTRQFGGILHLLLDAKADIPADFRYTQRGYGPDFDYQEIHACLPANDEHHIAIHGGEDGWLTITESMVPGTAASQMGDAQTRASQWERPRNDLPEGWSSHMDEYGKRSSITIPRPA
jgi:ankyrin repeat protein